MTPNGQAATQYPQPLQTSSCTTTVPNSVRNRAPVGHTSRQAAWVQCLQTSDDISQRTPASSSVAAPGPIPGIPRSVVSTTPVDPTPSVEPTPLVEPVETTTDLSTGCSMNATCRQVLAPSSWVLS